MIFAFIADYLRTFHIEKVEELFNIYAEPYGGSCKLNAHSEIICDGCGHLGRYSKSCFLERSIDLDRDI
ncbi:MAG: hypothetical protein ACHQUC_07355 [Chlamydiales bacterium]